MNTVVELNQRADWVIVLEEECKRTSQKKTADLIGYSPAVVNTVLKGTYKGDLSKVEDAVRGALMHKTLQCPIIGELATNRCLEYQKRPFAATNPQRVKLYRACRSCPNNRIGR